jgi:putative transport protein
MDWFAGFLEKYPELAVFLAIALGYLVGGVKFGEFSFGPVTGSLLAGLAIGQVAHVPVSPMAKAFLFLLFLFGIGYSVGPQFLQALRQSGVKPLLLALVCALTGLGTVIVVARILDLDSGYAAGLLSGGLTQSPAMGTATEAIGSLGLADADRDRLIAHVAIADAICYVFGAIGMIWFCSVLGPRLLGIDLKAESLALEQSLGMSRTTPGVQSGYRPFELRAYPVPADAKIVGLSVTQAEARFPEARLFVLRLRRDGAIREIEPDFRIEAGDILAIGGRRSAIIAILGPSAAEVEDRELLDSPFLAAEFLVAEAATVGKSLQSLADTPWARGIYVDSLRRGAQPLPLAADLVLEGGDVLKLMGPQATVERGATQIGPQISPTTATDFIVLGFAIFLGGLAGALLRVNIAGIEVVLGTSVGALVAGLIVGHLRTRHPLFGRIPDGAVALMTSLGLAAFVAMTGLHAGPVFVPALKDAGLGLLLGGIVVTMTPLFVGLAFGHWVLRMNPVLLLGGLAGALTMTAAMAAIQARADSPVAVLGYTPAYPVAQILLTVWGTVVVILMA